MIFRLRCWQCGNECDIRDPRFYAGQEILCQLCHRVLRGPDNRPPKLTGYVFRTRSGGDGWWEEKTEDRAEKPDPTPGVTEYAVPRHAWTPTDLYRLRRLLIGEEERLAEEIHHIRRLLHQVTLWGSAGDANEEEEQE